MASSETTHPANEPSLPKFAAVILAGGSGTRFWPRSRRSRAKQVLALDGESTMIQQTLERLRPVAAPEDVWVITNRLARRHVISEQLPAVPDAHILSEPCPRNTAPACALAAFLLERTAPDTVIGIFPSDHVVSNTARFAQVLATGIRIAAAGENASSSSASRPPAPRPATATSSAANPSPSTSSPPKPSKSPRSPNPPSPPSRQSPTAAPRPPSSPTASDVSAKSPTPTPPSASSPSATTSGTAASSCGPPAPWPTPSASTPPTWPPRSKPSPPPSEHADFEHVFAEQYPLCENISIDYAVLEPRSSKGEKRSRIFSLPADFGWSDLGSWASLHEHRSEAASDNVVDGETTSLMAIQSSGNYVHAPNRMVALLGVQDLVVVQTDDALLITTRGRSQDVSKLVHAIHQSGREDLI